jgi:hypothetical protein
MRIGVLYKNEKETNMIIYSVYTVYSKNRKEFVKSFADEETANFFVRVMQKMDEKDKFIANEYKVDAVYLWTKEDLKDLWPEYKDV